MSSKKYTNAKAVEYSQTEMSLLNVICSKDQFTEQEQLKILNTLSPCTIQGQKNFLDQSVLMTACESGRLEVVKVLVTKFDADPLY